MGMNIKNQEAHDLALAIAREEGKTVTQVVLEALREWRATGPAERRRREIERAVRELQGVCRGMDLSTDELYDPETGMPA